MMAKPFFSVVVPVYNRPEEVRELLSSLSHQTFRDFEIILIEDGSSQPCREIATSFETLNITYHFKENTGPGDSRNVGMQMARGTYIVLFDSDCLIPAEYFQNVSHFLKKNPLDAYGGPDDAHPSFSQIQKAINYAMTSFITTGGIRGKASHLDRYQPRSFNMGMRKTVIENVGGFSDIHPGEDPDLSFRIIAAGYRVGLIPEAMVFHKRRIDFSKFGKQVYKFGLTRNILGKWHPGTTKAVYFLPTLFVFGTLVLVLLSMAVSAYFLIPLLVFAVAIFLESLVKSKNILIALLSVYAALVQLSCYGLGFINSFLQITIFGRAERKVYPHLFFTGKGQIDTKAE